ncbi:DHA2 family efflux MFS transporter permease subunit [Prauserella halophila]|uniref:DHA2 family efflux MFS transporter permease subunit n=1 Tax=Prauserella halophila TaxID=185641 RepID=A0ABP4H239_9PSEU|nr:MDR family MFS transporter [Prauserella halophila]MCP2238032.1 MFS transporter, DHA2 family, lincomycin resistance protein [Prauserella halophila]
MTDTAHTDTPAGEPGQQDRQAVDPKALLLIGVLVASAFVMILNETILSVALRQLSQELEITTTTAQWVTSGFLLTMAVIIPTTGFLLERFTPRQVFLASLTLFSAGTLLSALAPGFPVLLAGRVVQAGGTAVMIPLLMTSVMRLIPESRRGSMMGTIGIVIAVAPALGPTIGGAILSGLGWRWMFWLVLPLAIAALLIGARWLRLDTETRKVPLDVLSVVLSALGFGGLLYGLSSIGEGGGGHAVPPLVPIVAGLVVLSVFVWRQLQLQRRDRALLDLRPFESRDFVVSLTLTGLLFMCLLGVASILLPLYLQTVLDASAFESGLAVLPGGLALGLLGRPVGSLYDRIGPRPLVIPGTVAMASGLWLFTTLGPDSTIPTIVAYHVIMMVGLALMMTPLMTQALGSLTEQLQSHGSAILATLQQVAGALGTAVFVTVAAVASGADSAGPDADGLRVAFMIAGGIGVIAVATSLLLGKHKSSAATAGHGH